MPLNGDHLRSLASCWPANRRTERTDSLGRYRFPAVLPHYLYDVVDALIACCPTWEFSSRVIICSNFVLIFLLHSSIASNVDMICPFLFIYFLCTNQQVGNWVQWWGLCTVQRFTQVSTTLITLMYTYFNDVLLPYPAHKLAVQLFPGS